MNKEAKGIERMVGGKEVIFQYFMVIHFGYIKHFVILAQWECGEQKVKKIYGVFIMCRDKRCYSHRSYRKLVAALLKLAIDPMSMLLRYSKYYMINKEHIPSLLVNDYLNCNDFSTL